MAIMDAETAAEVKKHFDAIEAEVKIIYFTETLLCRTCGPAEEFYRELGQISPKVKLEVYNIVTDKEKADAYGVILTPGAVIEGPRGARVRFFGIPAGYEFVSLMEAIKNSAAPKQDLQSETIAALEALQAPVNIKVFVSPTCPYCPAAVAMAHKFALVSPKITAEMVESTEFPELAAKFDIAGVPKVILNDRLGLTGLQPEHALLAGVLEAARTPVPPAR